MRPLGLGPGDIVAGKYRVERVLGEGGMGVVLGAEHMTLGERVALKVLRPDTVTDGETVARFLREARAAARIKGDHVARVLDVGSPDDGMPYIAMEYLEGADLAQLVERQGVLPIPVAVDYVLQACEALAEAHALGIVHRDVKPSNLFLTRAVDGSPRIKVLDFGISKATSAADSTRPDFDMTATHSVLGSPAYMAPEQMRSSKRVDGRTDIWALGTILHELLTAQPPFSARTMPELCAMILQDAPPTLRARRPDVPPGLEAVVARCLEKEARQRYQTVHDVAEALAPFGGPGAREAAARVARVARPAADFASSQPNFQPPSLPNPLPGSDPGLGTARTVATTSGLGGRPRRRRLGAIFGGLAVLASVGAALGSFALGRRAAAPTTASATTVAASAPAATEATPATATPPASVTPPASTDGVAASVAPATPATPAASAEPSARLAKGDAKAKAAPGHTTTHAQSTPTRATPSATEAPPARTAPTPAASPPSIATSRYD